MDIERYREFWNDFAEHEPRAEEIAQEIEARRSVRIVGFTSASVHYSYQDGGYACYSDNYESFPIKRGHSDEHNDARTRRRTGPAEARSARVSRGDRRVSL